MAFVFIDFPAPLLDFVGFSVFCLFSLLVRSKNLSYPGTGNLWSSGTLWKGMEEILFLSMFRN